MSKSPNPPVRTVPSALQKRARALHEKAQASLAAKGFEALALIREKKADIAGNFVDIGHALGVLRGDGVAEALGRASFEDLCREDLLMAPTTARKMIAIAQHFRRETVLTLGADRAQALIELAEATPEDDTPEGLMTATLTLPSGATLEVARATATELHEAAREIRQTHRPSRRGLTVSAAHKKLYGEFNHRLKLAKAQGAKLKLIASRDKEGAWVELRVRLSDLAVVSGALRTKKTPKK